MPQPEEAALTRTAAIMTGPMAAGIGSGDTTGGATAEGGQPAQGSLVEWLAACVC